MTMVHNLGNVEITDRQIRSALLRAATVLGEPIRADADTAIYPEGMIDRYRPRLDAQFLQQVGRDWRPDPLLRIDAERAVAEGRLRADAITAGPAGFARSFEYIHQEILEEPRPQLNAGMLFQVDRRVPLGAPVHTARRATVAGKAKWHNKGDAFPLAKAGFEEESFKTGFAVCAVETSFFESLQIGFAGLQTYRLEASGAIRAIEEFANDVAFYGDPDRGIYGALNYPHMAKMVSPTRFNTGAGLSTGDQVVAALQTAANTPMIVSGSIFRPNRAVTDEATHAFLATTRMDSNGSSMTLKQFFLEGQSKTTGIRDIEIARELSPSEMTLHNVGNPAGYHGVLFYHDNIESTAMVMPQTPTFLPIWQSSPIDTLHVAFASLGGMVMHNLGNQLLLFVRL